MKIRQPAVRFVTGSGLLIVAVFLLLLSLSSCFPPYEPVETSSLPGEITIGSIEIDNRTLVFAESGDPDKPMVLFVHGTPGSKQGFLNYLGVKQLQDSAHLVSVDRPGFGESLDGNWLPGLKEQARLLAAMARVNRSGKPMTVVGHSLGGTIAYRMAMDFPEQIKAIVVISSSIDPVVGQARWYNHVGNNLLIRWMLPDGLAKANREIMPLKDELEAMTVGLSSLQPFVTVIHGDEDALVGFANVAYAERHLAESKRKLVPIEGEGHFILWERPDLIIPEIQQALEL